MKKLTAAVAAAAAVVLVSTVPGPVATASDALTTVTTPSISWGSCGHFDIYVPRAHCGYLSVPLDYAHPNGRHIKIAVSRVKHTSSAADYQGAIVVNPGGPGGPGLSMSGLGDSVPGGAGDDYDWIGFDPRGVGASQPALHCRRHYFHLDRPDYRPRTHHNVVLWKKRARGYAHDCADKHPALIRHMTTVDTAKDMDQIRRALGLSRISFYGFSYGTYLGQVFATLFPTHLRRMVLDSTVDPRRVWYGANLDQDRAFDRNINIWFRWVANYHDVYHLGRSTKSVRHRWYDALNALADRPAGGKIGPAEWTDTYLWAGYYRTTWATLGHAFSRYVHGGHWRATADFYRAYNSPNNDNGYAVYLAVECTDAHWPQHWSRWHDDAKRINATSPFETWDNTWFNAPCLWWQAPSRRPVTIRGDHAGSVLMIDETLDAATPFSGSLEVRRRFPRASLIAEPGGATHADSLFGDACVDNRIARYLATGHRPARQRWNGPDHLCRPLPDPVPRGASSAATGRSLLTRR